MRHDHTLYTSHQTDPLKASVSFGLKGETHQNL